MAVNIAVLLSSSEENNAKETNNVFNTRVEGKVHIKYNKKIPVTWLRNCFCLLNCFVNECRSA